MFRGISNATRGFVHIVVNLKRELIFTSGNNFHTVRYIFMLQDKHKTLL